MYLLLLLINNDEQKKKVIYSIYPYCHKIFHVVYMSVTVMMSKLNCLLLQVCLSFDWFFPLVRDFAEAYIDLAGNESWKKSTLCFLTLQIKLV